MSASVSVRDVRRLRRVATAGCLVGGPLAVLVVQLLIPSDSSSAQRVFDNYASHLGAVRAELAASVVAFVLLPFFVLGLYWLAARSAPLVAAIGGALSLVGWAALPAVIAGDALLFELVLHQGQAGVWDRFTNHDPTITVLTVIFVAGHTLGMALLAWALWRSKAVPRWAPGALLAGDVLHLLAHAASNRPLELVAFALITGCGVAAAREVLGTTDDAWDLPPVAPASAAVG